MKIKNLKVNKENFSEEVTLERVASVLKKRAIFFGTLTVVFTGMVAYTWSNPAHSTSEIVLGLFTTQFCMWRWGENYFEYKKIKKAIEQKEAKEKIKTLTKNVED